MGLFEIFKKKKRVPEIERISLEEVNGRMNRFLLEFKENENKIKEDIFNKIKIFSCGLREQIKILYLTNLEQRKEDIRLKGRVLESKDTYVRYCEKLVGEIFNLEKDNLEDFFKKINHILFKFQKNSNKSFEIATILIGKELAETRKIITDFSREQEILYLKNKEIFVKKRIATKILEEKNSLNNLKVIENNINTEFENLKKSLKDNVSLTKNQEQKILEFKKTKEFQKWLAYNKEKKVLKFNLLKKVEILREKIGLKSLLSIHHKNEKLKGLIKKYRNNFVESLIEDKENSLSQIISKELNEEIIRIKEKLNELNKEEYSEIKKEEKNLEEELNRINEEILRIKRQKEECEKKLGKFKIKENEKIEEIKKDLANLKLEIY